MAGTPLLIAFMAGFILGLAIAFGLRLIQAKSVKQLAEELFRESEVRRQADFDRVMCDLKHGFAGLSLDALSKATEEFLKLAKSRLDAERQLSVQELDAKKDIIDHTLKRMNTALENVTNLMQDLEKDRVRKFGELAGQLEAAKDQTAALLQTTHTLREALVSTPARGQWGERMAEDVLRVAGFIEGVNYFKQKAVEGIGTRPDFTFLLPKNLKLNMDVKFPLDNYLRFLEANANIEKNKFRRDFLRDVKSRIKEIASREYINPDQNTLDYVLLFIPNEQIYTFIQEQDSAVLDNALQSSVVLCSPLTLFAVLAVIRQAVDNFALEQTSKEILSLMGQFNKQWDAFVGKLDLLGKRLVDAQKEYEALISTRRRQLEKPLRQIEDMRAEKHVSAPPEQDEDPSPAVSRSVS
jgi:DNA recombination protein RmuC